MCKAQERPHRRHRAMYLAPSPRPFHPQLNLDHSEQTIPLLLVEPLADLTTAMTTAEANAPPTTLTPLSNGDVIIPTMHMPTTVPPKSPRWTFRIGVALLAIYHWFVDVLILIMVCFMGCFFYDVEVKVVQCDRRQPAPPSSSFPLISTSTTARGGGRVVLWTEERRRSRVVPPVAPISSPSQLPLSIPPIVRTHSPPRTGPRTTDRRLLVSQSTMTSTTMEHGWDVV